MRVARRSQAQESLQSVQIPARLQYNWPITVSRLSCSIFASTSVPILFAAIIFFSIKSEERILFSFSLLHHRQKSFFFPALVVPVMSAYSLLRCGTVSNFFRVRSTMQWEIKFHFTVSLRTICRTLLLFSLRDRCLSALQSSEVNQRVNH